MCKCFCKCANFICLIIENVNKHFVGIISEFKFFFITLLLPYYTFGKEICNISKINLVNPLGHMNNQSGKPNLDI